MSEEENKLEDIENDIPEEENPTTAQEEDGQEDFTTLHMVDVPNIVKNMGLQQR